MAAADIQEAKSTTSKSRAKSTSRKKPRYTVLPNLKPDERISSKPNDYDVELSFKGVFGYSKKKIELTRGKLIIKKKNGTIKHIIDLGLSVVAFFKVPKRITINTESDMYNFKLNTDDAFDQCLEQIRIHRLYRQSKKLFGKSKKSSKNVTPDASESATASVKLNQSVNRKLRRIHEKLRAKLRALKKLISKAETTETLTKEDIKTLKLTVAETIKLHKKFERKFYKFIKKKSPPSSERTSKTQPSTDRTGKDKSEGDEDEEGSASVRSITIPIQLAKKVESAPVPKMKVHHRSRLPVPMKEFNLSLWSIMKQTIGKDLSKISFPIELLEPLGVLQVLCEELEYSNLLDRAATTDDVTLRMGLVAAFAVSRYSATPSRIFRKPFNPVEGETYENVREDLGWRYLAEQVNCNPPISAVHVKGNKWEISQNMACDLSFWGRSIQAEPKTPVDLVLHDFHETYRWNKVKTTVNNLIAGTRYTEHIGDMIIKSSNKTVCKLKFKKNTQEVIGSVYDSRSKEVLSVSGKWSQSLTVESGGKSECIWKNNRLPSDSEKYYGFTRFAITLNELTPELTQVLPPTDSRLRTDQRNLEDGRIEEAKKQKIIIENKQSERLKQKNYTPKWFSEDSNSNKLDRYRFNNHYWNARKNKFTDESFEELWPAN